MTGRRAIFHLGTFKTGSSSLQNLLHDNYDMLRAEGILYPKSVIGGPRDLGMRHNKLVYGFLVGDKPLLPETLKDEIAHSGCDTVVFSAEAWSKPAHLRHLTRFVPALEDIGFDRFEAVLCLRNLARYQVSYFREFTVNHQNRLTYAEHIRREAGVFDYLFLLQQLRGQFGDELRVLDFDLAQDIRRDILAGAGLGDLWPRMTLTENANLKSLSAIEIEAKRCANALGLTKAQWHDSLPALLTRISGATEGEWTERIAGDTPVFPAPYRARLRHLTGWTAERIDALLAAPAPEGRDVSALSAAIMSELNAILH